jgi:ABC-2 type transport system ATP-binding protein
MKLFAEIHGVDKGIIDWVLQVVQLSDAKKKPVSQLSKGMRQRLVFARAILHDPDLLFLDEPTSGLDPATAQEIHRLIFELRRRGTTIFMTTHNMSEATLLCDHVALLNEGKIAEYGEPEALCRKYDSKRKLRICLKNGEEVELDNAPESADWVSYYIKEGMLESIHSSEPDLATVFIDLTGRKLM